MLKPNRRKWGISVIAVLISGIVIATSLIIFNVNTVNNIEQFIHLNMEETNEAAIASINFSLKSYMEMMEQQAKMFGFLKEGDSEGIMQAINTFSEDERFSRATFVTVSGKAYSSIYGIVDGDLDIVKNMDKDYTTIAEPRISSVGELVVEIGTPVYCKGKLTGRLVATLDTEQLHGMYIANSLQGDASLTMITSDGTVLVNIAEREMPTPVNGNVFDVHDGSTKFIKSNLEKVKEDMRYGRSGWLKYKKTGTVCMNYQPMGINGWYMCISSTDNTLDMQAGDIISSGYALTFAVLISVCIVCAIIIVQRLREQARVDALKNTYSTAIRKTNDLFYEADIVKDTLTNFSENQEKAIWEETPKKYTTALSEIASVCAPQYRQQFMDAFLPQNIRAKVKQGVSYINLEYKLLLPDDVVRWHNVTIVPIVDSSNNPTKLICMENDVTEKRQKQESLKLSATIDGLTTVYNKVTTESYINDYLQNFGFDGQHALLIIDIDRFKEINDTLGHAKGDEVLVEYSGLLKSLFNKEDIIGRIGGDEFVILLKNYEDVDSVMDKATKVCEAFRKEHCLPEDYKKSVRSSASVGIALYKKDGNNFTSLYKNADLALYKAKKNGRDNVQLSE